MIRIPKIKKTIIFLTLMSLVFAFSGCVDNSEQPVTPISTNQSTGSEENLPPLMNITVMKSILPDDLPGEWEYQQNYSSDGTVTTFVSKPGNHKSVITIQDKRTEQLAKYAEFKNEDFVVYLNAIKTGIIYVAKGDAPIITMEAVREMIPPLARPGFDEAEATVKGK